MSGSNSSAHGDGAPPEPLSLSVHGLAVPDLADPVQARRRRTIGGRIKMLLVLLICAAPVIASYLTFYVVRPQARSRRSRSRFRRVGSGSTGTRIIHSPMGSTR